MLEMKTFNLSEKSIDIDADNEYLTKDFFAAANFFQFLIYSEKELQNCYEAKANIFWMKDWVTEEK